MRILAAAVKTEKLLIAKLRTVLKNSGTKQKENVCKKGLYSIHQYTFMYSYLRMTFIYLSLFIII